MGGSGEGGRRGGEIERGGREWEGGVGGVGGSGEGGVGGSGEEEEEGREMAEEGGREGEGDGRGREGVEKEGWEGVGKEGVGKEGWEGVGRRRRKGYLVNTKLEVKFNGGCNFLRISLWWFLLSSSFIISLLSIKPLIITVTYKKKHLTELAGTEEEISKVVTAIHLIPIIPQQLTQMSKATHSAQGCLAKQVTWL